ncbi:unnamed protein product [Cuscuta campestris]|uniref:Uncharacterized protein n=1 Tax=Cuscuta campestris TaxID=132261 RepID=A0A484M3S3_9ASTE|nr:unnamed protein product [Cuscuta campestris]
MPSDALWLAMENVVPRHDLYSRHSLVNGGVLSDLNLVLGIPLFILPSAYFCNHLRPLFASIWLAFGVEVGVGSCSSCSRNFRLEEEARQAQTPKSPAVHPILQRHGFPEFFCRSMVKVEEATSFRFMSRSDERSTLQLQPT